MLDYYEILQVSPNASNEAISAAYRRLIKVHHPDLGGDEQKMKMINEAYSVLKNPEKRFEYDRFLANLAAHRANQDGAKETASANDAHIIHDKEKFLSRLWAYLLNSYLFRGALGLFLTAAIFITVNALFLGGQELYHYSDNQKLSRLEEELNTEKSQLEALENQLKTMQNDLASSENQMQRWENNGMTEEYNTNLSTHNSMVEDYNSLLSAYEDKRTSYNIKVDEYNKLDKETGSRWHLIPVPRGTHIK